MWDARRLADDAMVDLLPAPRDRGAAVVAGVVAVVGIFVLHDDADYLFDGLTSRALPLVILSALCGMAALVLLAPRHPTAAPGSPPSARWPAWSSAGASPSGTTCCPRQLTVVEAAAPSGTITAVLVATGSRRC